MKIETENKTLSLDNSKVVVNLKKSIPSKFYKYIGINKYSVENLQSNKIHFSHPFKLNDLMEGNSQLWDLDEYIIEYQQKTGYSTMQILKLLTQDFLEDVFTHKGVLCLTTEYNNNLFWPHYTNEMGICIEFDSNLFLESFANEDYILFPIDYEDLKRINFKEFVVYNNLGKKISVNVNLPIIYSLSVKDKIWSYEQEWRIVLRKENLGKVSHPLRIIDDKTFNEEKEKIINRNLEYRRNSISKIIFSTLFFNNTRFNKIDRTGDFYKYYFRKTDVDLFNLLVEIHLNYNDKLYQVDRDIKDGRIVSVLNYHIKIIELTENSIMIDREYLS